MRKSGRKQYPIRGGLSGYGWERSGNIETSSSGEGSGRRHSCNSFATSSPFPFEDYKGKASKSKTPKRGWKLCRGIWWKRHNEESTTERKREREKEGGHCEAPVADKPRTPARVRGCAGPRRSPRSGTLLPYAGLWSLNLTNKWNNMMPPSHLTLAKPKSWF